MGNRFVGFNGFDIFAGRSATFVNVGSILCLVWGQAKIQRPFKKKVPKPPRNARCPCGSDKKYKRCCGMNDEN